MITQTDALTEWSVEAVIMNSRHCEDFFHRDRIRLSTRDTESVTAPREVLQRLTEWSKLQTSSSSLLWLHSEHSDASNLDDPFSLFATRFILLLEQTKLPVISYFCELRRHERLRSGNKSIEQQGLLALGYALLRQMIELLERLLPTFTAAIDLSESRFARLDGSKDTFDDLIHLLTDLTLLMPSTVYVIIDGMQWLNDRTTNHMAKQLISWLSRNKDKLRVLFTTSGRSEVLLGQLDRGESVFVEEDMLQGYGVVLDRSPTVLQPKSY